MPGWAALWLLLCLLLPAWADPALRIGLDGEFGLPNSCSAQAIERGIRLALDGIHRSVPARGVRNLEELAALPGMVAVFTGRFSPVALEQMEPAQRLGVIPLDPWAAADAITTHGHVPNYVFRLSLRAGWAMPMLARHALETRKAERVS